MAQLVISIKCDENLKPVKTRYEVAAHLLVGDKPSELVKQEVFNLYTLIWTNKSAIYVKFRVQNKLAKARKMRKPPGTLSLKKFGLGNLWVK